MHMCKQLTTLKCMCYLLLLAMSASSALPANASDIAEVALAGRSNVPLSTSAQILVLMTILSLLPSILLMMSAFTRIIIVLSILRQALGLTHSPPNQVLVGMSLFLTFFVMSPTLNDINTMAIKPYAAQAITFEQALETGGGLLRGFMLTQTREKDIRLFAGLKKVGPFQSTADIPYSILLPAFVTSELKTAFQIGFLIFLPFLVIDLVVASVLTALGMMMMSPTLISLPLKLLLFVAIDGWALTMGSLAASFGTG